ncbi:MAG TPA: hypothetical protein VH643_33220 [Gemmataceae bacterium]|jgi:hypothetical protein
MSFLRWLKAIGGRGAARASANHQTVRPILESLEERIAPINHLPTYTNATVQIIPNLSNFTVTEKVTANVTATDFIEVFPVGSGTVLFNLNNQQQSANLDRNGQATAIFTLPLLTLLTSQTLQVTFPVMDLTSFVFGSEFLAPLYTNFDNLLLPATLTFGTLTHEQLVTHPIMTGVLPSFNTAQGESNNMGILNFHYNDPGTITSFDVFGFTLPGSLAFAVGAYGPEFMPASNNGG